MQPPLNDRFVKHPMEIVENTLYKASQIFFVSVFKHPFETYKHSCIMARAFSQYKSLAWSNFLYQFAAALVREGQLYIYLAVSIL